MRMKNKNVVILGASNNPERYSHKAFTLLKEQGFTVIPVHPALKEINGVPVVASLSQISEPVDTVTR